MWNPRSRTPPPPLKYEVPFMPTVAEVADKMLRMARVGPDDVVLDLGCGDARILRRAARKFGARGIGVDIDPEMVAMSRAAIEREGLSSLIEVRRGDLFRVSLKPATVVVLFLLPHFLARLAPKLSGLRKGGRVISHAFPIPGLKETEFFEIRRKDRFNRKLFLYEF